MAKSNSTLPPLINSPNITIDENVPGVTNLTLYSNNSNSSLARAGDLINITLEAC